MWTVTRNGKPLTSYKEFEIKKLIKHLLSKNLQPKLKHETFKTWRIKDIHYRATSLTRIQFYHAPTGSYLVDAEWDAGFGKGVFADGVD